MAQAYARAGKQDEARNILRKVRDQPVSPYAVAGVHAALAENEAAFQALDEAYEQRDMQLVSLKVDPTLDALRFDSRFPELVKRIGLPQ